MDDIFDYFAEFSYEISLGYLLNGHDGLRNEETLFNDLVEIDRHVGQLTNSYKGIIDALNRRDIYTLIGFATVSLVLLIPLGSVATLAAQILGTTSIGMLQYLQWKIDAANNTYGSLIFREGDQIVREGEYKSR